jgi:hypothetical protein
MKKNMRSAPTVRPANKKIRQFKFEVRDVKLVTDHLKEHGSIKKGDLEIPWVDIFPPGNLKTNSQLKLPPGPHNRTRLMARETPSGPWLEIVPREMNDLWLRSQMLQGQSQNKAASKMPLSRDAGYHWLKGQTLGISRRALWTFLEKQEHLQMSRNIPNERRKGGPTRGNVGHVEIDIVHIVKSRLSDREYGQLVELFDEKLDFGQRDGYILTVINQITRYGYGKFQRKKNATETASSIRFLFPIMERKHKAPITHCYSDQGKEFLGQVKEYFVSRNIKHKLVARGAHVEHYNQVLQRSFYRCLDMKRGSIKSCLYQAVDIVNNTFNRRLGMTPQEAIDDLDRAKKRYNQTRDQGNMDYMKTRKPKIGDKCRVLTNLRKLIRDPKGGVYKPTRQQHFSRQVHRIKHVDEKNLRYYAGGSWRDRDQIMIISGVDPVTKHLLAERHKADDE